MIEKTDTVEHQDEREHLKTVMQNLVEISPSVEVQETSKFWTEDEIAKISNKPSTFMGTLVDVQGPLFIVKLDECHILGGKELFINPFHIEEYEPTEENYAISMQDESSESNYYL